MAVIKHLTIDDISQAKKLSDAEGWNQTVRDWKLLITAPGNICLAFSSGDKIVATATAMTYRKELAWIGMVLVDKEYRGKGLSKMLMTTLLDELKAFRSVKLDATPAGQPVYQKLGFKNKCLVYRMTSEAINLEMIQSLKKDSAKQFGVAGISEIVKYDRQVMGINREVLMDYLFKEYPRFSFIVRRHNTIKGFVMGRIGTRFYQVGPLVAETVGDAKELLAGALYGNVGNTIGVDVPEDKEDLIKWLKNAGFTIQRNFIRMHLRDVPSDHTSEKCFLIAGPEFG